MEPGTVKPVNWQKLNPEGKVSTKKPDWLRVKLPIGEGYKKVRYTLYYYGNFPSIKNQTQICS